MPIPFALDYDLLSRNSWLCTLLSTLFSRAVFAMKRSASTELVGVPSPFHSGVTLFEPGSSTPRRSKRLKVESTTEVDSVTVEKKPATKGKTRKAAVKVEQTESVAEVVVKPARQSASPRKPKAIPQALATPHPAPPRWREQYDTIKRMREHIVAPVDTMGCDQAQRNETDPRVCIPYRVYSRNLT